MTRRASIACLMAMALSGGIAGAGADDPVDRSSPQTAKAAKGGAVAFKRIDTNHDGMISKPEFEAAAEKRAQRRGRAAGPSGDRLFARLDTDRNGSLSPAEFQKVQMMRGRLRSKGGRKAQS